MLGLLVKIEEVLVVNQTLLLIFNLVGLLQGIDNLNLYLGSLAGASP